MTKKRCGGRGVRRLAEAVLILSRCQHFLRQCRGRRRHVAAQSQAPCRGEGTTCIPQKLPLVSQEGPVTLLQTQYDPPPTSSAPLGG